MGLFSSKFLLPSQLEFPLFHIALFRCKHILEQTWEVFILPTFPKLVNWMRRWYTQGHTFIDNQTFKFMATLSKGGWCCIPPQPSKAIQMGEGRRKQKIKRWALLQESAAVPNLVCLVLQAKHHVCLSQSHKKPKAFALPEATREPDSIQLWFILALIQSCQWGTPCIPSWRDSHEGFLEVREHLFSYLGVALWLYKAGLCRVPSLLEGYKYLLPA